MIRKTAIAFVFIIVSLLLAVLGVNFVYTSGLIDFYKPELVSFNSKNDLSEESKQDTLLIMGDSFTAGNHSYPSILRNILPYRVINAGVPGTGIIQTAIMAKGRIARFKPKVFIYQIYVGNDLFDITYPVNWKTISPARNIYWLIVSRVQVIGYINYRLGQIKASENQRDIEYPSARAFEKDDEIFSAERYTKRELIYSIAEPDLVNNSVLLEGARKKDFDTLIDRLVEVLKTVPADCKKIVLVVPHKAQVNESYLRESIAIGVQFPDPGRILNSDYPFFTQLRKRLPVDVVTLNALLPLRKAESSGIKVYYANDGHLNNNGQKIVAEYIGSHVKSLASNSLERAK